MSRYIVKYLLDNLIKKLFLKKYCNTFYYLTTFMVTYMTVGGLVTAIYRVSYIKAPNCVKYKIGEVRLLVVLVLVGLLLTMSVPILFEAGRGTRANFNLCLGYHYATEVNGIDDLVLLKIPIPVTR